MKIAVILPQLCTLFFLLMASDNLPKYKDTPRTGPEIVAYIKYTLAPELDALLNNPDSREPLNYVLLRAYKIDREMEVWIDKNADNLSKIATYPICAMDFEPGPKLKEGDKRTPEGEYELDIYYNSKNWFMWMDLRPDHINKKGKVGKGSAFRLCSDYPRKHDVERSESIGIKNPGSAICVHGNCHSLGCPSLKNRDFAAVFYFVMHHDIQSHGKPKIQIFPFRFKPKLYLEQLAKKAAAYNDDTKMLGYRNILNHWKSLEKLEKQTLPKIQNQ